MEEIYVSPWEITCNHLVEPREIKYRLTTSGFGGWGLQRPLLLLLS